jgi:hypothetical protein
MQLPIPSFRPINGDIPSVADKNWGTVRAEFGITVALATLLIDAIAYETVKVFSQIIQYNTVHYHID